MRRPTLLLVTLGIFLLFSTLSASAGTRSCTSSMVSLNICRDTTDVAYCLAIGTVDPDGAGPLTAPSALVADAFAWAGNWQTPAACTSDMVTAGICNAGQLGTLVAITKAQFADLQVRAFILDTIKRYRAKLQHDAAQLAADAEAPPNIGN